MRQLNKALNKVFSQVHPNGVKCACGKNEPSFYEGTLESGYVATSEMEECC